jgi:hypothetical protein
MLYLLNGNTASTKHGEREKRQRREGRESKNAMGKSRPLLGNGLGGLLLKAMAGDAGRRDTAARGRGGWAREKESAPSWPKWEKFCRDKGQETA